MNDPIISPWLIYLIGIVEPLTCFIRIAAMIVVCYSIIQLEHEMNCYYDDINEAKKARKAKKNFLAFGVAIGFLSMFIPTPSTIYKMIAASYVTPANIQATGELADKAVDKVIDKIADAIQKFERSDKK